MYSYPHHRQARTYQAWKCILPTTPFWLTHLLKYYQWVSNATFKVHVTTNIIISADTDSLFHRECSKPPVACQDDSHRVVYISSFSHSHEYQPLGRWCEPRCDSWCSVSSDGLMSIHHTVDRDSPCIGTVLLPSVCHNIIKLNKYHSIIGNNKIRYKEKVIKVMDIIDLKERPYLSRQPDALT